MLRIEVSTACRNDRADELADNSTKSPSSSLWITAPMCSIAVRAVEPGREYGGVEVNRADPLQRRDRNGPGQPQCHPAIGLICVVAGIAQHPVHRIGRQIGAVPGKDKKLVGRHVEDADAAIGGEAGPARRRQFCRPCRPDRRCQPVVPAQGAGDRYQSTAPSSPREGPPETLGDSRPGRARKQV